MDAAAARRRPSADAAARAPADGAVILRTGSAAPARFLKPVRPLRPPFHSAARQDPQQGG